MESIAEYDNYLCGNLASPLGFLSWNDYYNYSKETRRVTEQQQNKMVDDVRNGRKLTAESLSLSTPSTSSTPATVPEAAAAPASSTGLPTQSTITLTHANHTAASSLVIDTSKPGSTMTAKQLQRNMDVIRKREQELEEAGRRESVRIVPRAATVISDGDSLQQQQAPMRELELRPMTAEEIQRHAEKKAAGALTGGQMGNYTVRRMTPKELSDYNQKKAAAGALTAEPMVIRRMTPEQLRARDAKAAVVIANGSDSDSDSDRGDFTGSRDFVVVDKKKPKSFKASAPVNSSLMNSSKPVANLPMANSLSAARTINRLEVASALRKYADLKNFNHNGMDMVTQGTLVNWSYHDKTYEDWDTLERTHKVGGAAELFKKEDAFANFFDRYLNLITGQLGTVTARQAFVVPINLCSELQRNAVNFADYEVDYAEAARFMEDQTVPVHFKKSGRQWPRECNIDMVFGGGNKPYIILSKPFE